MRSSTRLKIGWNLALKLKENEKKAKCNLYVTFCFLTISLLSLRCGTLFERLRCLLER